MNYFCSFILFFLFLFSSLFLACSDTQASRPDNVAGSSSLLSFDNRTRSDLDFPNRVLHFIPNRGQVDASAKFYVHTSVYTLWLTSKSLIFDTILPANDFGEGDQEEDNKLIRRVVSRLHFIDANINPELMPGNGSEFTVNILKGDDREKWQLDIPTSQTILYKNLYKGIDLKVYGDKQQVEYDWIVRPGGSPLAIQFEYSGVGKTEIDEQGNLLVTIGSGRLIHKRPVTYQQIDNKRVEVSAEYKRFANDTYGFQVAKYNANYALIIDPVVLAYSTYLGGSGNDESRSIAVDSQGNVYVTGVTYSTDFPTLDQYMMDPGDADGDVFITKINPARSGGDSLVYSTYIGGSGKDSASGIAVDDNGMVYVAGETLSTDFPVLNQYMSDSGDGNSDAFICKLDTTRNGTDSLVYSTYIGGSGRDSASGIAVDDSGIVYVVGETLSTDFPTVKQYMDDPGDSNRDAFISKLDTSKSGSSSLMYSTYLGGMNSDSGKGIAIDGSGLVYVTGGTQSTDFPTVKEYMADPADSNSDVFLSRLDTRISGKDGLLFSTYLGGDSVDSGTGIVIDKQGNAFVTGETLSSDFPVVNEYMANPGDGLGNAFVSKIATGTGGAASLLFSTYLGGNDSDIGWAITVDSKDNAYVTGETWSSDFPVKDQLFPCQATFSTDAFLSKINTNGTGSETFLFSTCLGGSDDDFGNGVAVDNHGSVYLTGVTRSSNFPLHNPYMAIGGEHSFITKINMSSFPWALFLPAMFGPQ